MTDVAILNRISQIIKERFRYHIGWPYIRENKNSIAHYSQCYFHVNNKEGLLDNVVTDLMSTIENVMKR